GTAAGPISLNTRRRYQQERAAHMTRCPICKTCRLPSADISRAACEFAGVNPARFAYSVAGLLDDERADYLTVARQAMTIVLACRIRRRASNNNFMDALGTAFSVVYRHVRALGVARSIREMTEAHA